MSSSLRKVHRGGVRPKRGSAERTGGGSFFCFPEGKQICVLLVCITWCCLFFFCCQVVFVLCFWCLMSESLLYVSPCDLIIKHRVFLESDLKVHRTHFPTASLERFPTQVWYSSPANRHLYFKAFKELLVGGVGVGDVLGFRL